MIWKLILTALIGYVLGNVTTGVAIARIMGGPDLKKTGSGNVGTTNMLRTMGWWASALTLGGDVLKGVLSALIGLALSGEPGMLLGGLFSVIGHDFPVLQGFKGGKGIATSFGCTLVVCPLVAPMLVLVMLPTVILTRIMSAGTLLAAMTFPLLHLWLAPRTAYYWCYVIYSVLLLALTLFCHRQNLVRLAHGQENRLDFGKITRLTRKYHLRKKNRK